MEQKRILWFVAAVGIILVIVIGAGLIFYPLTKKDPVISTDTNTQSNTWMNPVQQQEETSVSPFPSEAETNVQEITSVTDDSNLYSDNVTTIDLNKLAAPTDFTTVRSDTAPVSEKKETVAAKPVTTSKPVTTTAKPATSTADKSAVTTTKKTTTEKPAAKTTVTEYWVQTGAFSNREYAENAQDSIAAYKIESEIFTKEVSGKTWYRVRMGPYKTRTEADYWMTVIKSDPIFADSYITEVKTSK